MEIASKRTEEERSSQDKVDEEVSEDFCSCYEIKINLASSKQWKMFCFTWQNAQLISKTLFVIMRCLERVEMWSIKGHHV